MVIEEEEEEEEDAWSLLGDQLKSKSCTIQTIQYRELVIGLYSNDFIGTPSLLKHLYFNYWTKDSTELSSQKSSMRKTNNISVNIKPLKYRWRIATTHRIAI